MAAPVKTDIVYYRTQSDFELEFNLNGCCSMRVLQNKPKTTQEFLKAMRLAVSRSQIILTLGDLSGDDSLIDKVCNAIGYTTEERDLSVFGFMGSVALPEGSIPLVSNDGQFAGCVIECGPQSIIVLTDDRELRKNVMQTLVHQYIRDFSGNRKPRRVPTDTQHPVPSQDTGEAPLIDESTYVIKEKKKPEPQKPAEFVTEDVPQKKRKHPFITVLVVLLFLAAGLAAYIFLAEPYIISNAYEGYASLYGESGDYYDAQMLDSFGELYDMNNDTVGFLKVGGTNIACPVVSDAERGEGYYEKHLFEGQYYRHGTPYTHHKLEPQSFIRNFIIFGNSTYGELMFSELEKVSSLAGYRISPTFTFDTLYGESGYKIFAAFTCSREASGAYLVSDFEDDEQFGEFMSSVLARSFIKTTVDLNKTDRTVTLVVRGEELDTFIVARALRQGESELVDTQNASAGNLSYELSDLPENGPSALAVKFTPVVKPALYSKFFEQYKEPLPFSTMTPPEGESSSDSVESDSSSGEPDSSDTVTGDASSETESGETAAPVIDYENEILNVINAETDARVSGTTLDIISQMVQAEMGDDAEIEALKAQAVACYSYVHYNLANGQVAPEVPLKIASSRTRDAVREVLGKRVYYNEQPALTYYYRCSAGYSTDSATVWGVSLPYLVACDSSFDRNSSEYLTRRSFSAENLRAWVLESTGTDLGSIADKNKWLNVSYDKNGVYALSVRFGGGENYCARYIRDSILTKERVGEDGLLPSTAFTVTYRPSTDSFVFECRGVGHGVGMSINGANVLAKNGQSYEDILAYYYKDIVIR